MLSKRGKKYYLDTYDADGKRVRKSLNTEDKKEAKELAAKMMAGVAPKTASKSPTGYGPTLHEAYKRAMREYKSWRDTNSPRTIEKNRKAVEEFFGADRRLATIDREAIIKFTEHMHKQDLAGSTINQRLSQLSVLFDEAIDNWGYVNLVKPRIVRAKVADGRTRRFSPAEEAEAIRRLQESGRAHHKDVADVVAVLFDTGMRLNEAVQLTAFAVKLDERLIIAWKTKNKQPRGVPMTERVYQIMAARQGKEKPFHPLTDNIVSKAWQWVREEMGFAEDREFVIHTMRHTVGSRLADAGVSGPLIQQMLGHKSMMTTQKYIHVSAAGLRSVVDVLAKAGAVGVAESVSKVGLNEAEDGPEQCSK